MGLSWGAIGGALQKVIPVEQRTVAIFAALLEGPAGKLAVVISEAISHSEANGGDGHSKRQHVRAVARASIQTFGIANEEISEELIWLLDDAREYEVRARETYARILRLVDNIKARRSTADTASEDEG
jgi:hypothetical protein